MKPKIPSVQITPEAVIAFCQKPTSAQAERWLSRQHKCIEGMMTSIIEDNLEEILDEACLRAYPDPRFDKQYRLVDGAIMDAAENYAQEIGQEHLGQSHTEADMIEMVRRMIDQKGIFAACIACSHEFGPQF